MADLILTTDFTQLNNMNNALNETANTVERRVNPVLQRLQENLQFQERVNQQLTQSNQMLARSFSMSELNQAAQRMQNYEAALANSRQGMNSFGVVTQQAGYQIGDFLVQVQSGTNWLVAFGQQATQLVGVLPMMTGFMGLSTTALVGLSAGLGIAIPLVTALGAAWLRTTENVESGGSRIEEVLKTLQQETDSLNQKWSELKFGNIAGQSIEDLKNQASALRAEIEALTIQASESVLRPFINLQGYSIEQKKQELQLVIDRLNALEEENRINQERAAQLEKAKAINEQMLAVELGHARAIGDAKREQEAMSEAAQDALGKYSMMRTVAAGIANEMARAATNTRAAAEAALSAMKIEFSPAGQAMEQYAGRGATSNKPVTLGVGGVVDYSGGTSAAGSGGSGGGGNSRLDSLINQLQTEREVLDEWYATSQETLMAASENELSIIGGYNEAKLRLAEEYQQRLKAINEEGKASQLETVLSGSAQILGAMGAFSDKALRISKAFAAAEALVSTYKGAAKELEKGVIGFGTAAALIAKGLAFVAAIRGVSSSGNAPSVSSGGSARGSATVAPTTAAAPTPQTVFIDSIDPKSLYSGETLINLFEAFYNENDKRGKVFVVAR